MPQTTNADVIYTNLSSSPEIVGNLRDPSFQINFGPNAQLNFLTHHISTTIASSVTFRSVLARQAGGYVMLKTNGNSFAVHVGAGLRWSDVPGGVPGSWTTAGMGSAKSFSHYPANGYDHEYLLFKFKDNLGDPWHYGWIEVGLANNNLSVGSGDGPIVTIYGYAWDTTGAQLPTGSVPEPSSVALLALGAMALGAKGLRSWRRNRPASDS